MGAGASSHGHVRRRRNIQPRGEDNTPFLSSIRPLSFLTQRRVEMQYVSNYHLNYRSSEGLLGKKHRHQRTYVRTIKPPRKPFQSRAVYRKLQQRQTFIYFIIFLTSRRDDAWDPSLQDHHASPRFSLTGVVMATGSVAASAVTGNTQKRAMMSSKKRMQAMKSVAEEQELPRVLRSRGGAFYSYIHMCST